MFEQLEWRLVGPHRGGRTGAVAGDPTNPLVFYFGACAGGVFKTDDGGASWRPISDGFLGTGSVGAIAVAESDPNVIYIGMGECNIRDNVSHGDGVYRSTDRGETWQHLGLKETRHISRVRVHPKNPDLVYVSALGHAWGPNPERGVYRSSDGGANWERILFTDEHSGAIDLVLDPTNPRILYAALWEAQRGPHYLSSGGAGSGIYKSVDGGDSWTRIDTAPGLSTGIKGRIGLAASPARPGRIWASIEADPPGIFRSDDGGALWKCVSSNRQQLLRPWYFMHVFADPVNADKMFALNLSAWKSIDGGASFSQLPIAHGDTHDLWVDPKNPNRMIMGNDGGATISYDGGDTWTTQYNQPTAQFYQVITDDQFPYRIYGSQQDNTTVSIPTRADRGVINRLDWHPVGGHESGWIAVNPSDPNIVYGGIYSSPLTRYDHRSGQVQDVTVWPDDPTGHPAKDIKYRFNWTFPILFSPHDSNVLYTCGNHVFRTTNEGLSWDVISPDLTRNDITKLQSSGGPITQDNFVTEHYCTIFALAESPLEAGVIWAGSDDGLIHLTRDGGGSWTNVTPPQLPEWALISFIEASPHEPGAAYVAATRYKLDDFQPYLFKTNDYGQTWSLIVDGLPDDHFTRVIRADLKRAGLLYAGTEAGVYVSLNDGASWTSLQLNLPVAPIYGLDVRHGDLVAGTHGRSFWVLDDLTPFQEETNLGGRNAVHLFQPRPAYRLNDPTWYLSGGEPNKKAYLAIGGDVQATVFVKALPDNETTLEPLDAGENPPAGLAVDFLLGAKLPKVVTLTIYDADGTPIHRRSTKGSESDGRGDAALTVHEGHNRYMWDLRYPDPVALEQGRLFNYWARSVRGPLAAPGSYEVELEADGKKLKKSFQVLRDPRTSAGDDDLRAQFELLLKIRDKLSDVHATVNQARKARAEVAAWLSRLEHEPQAAHIVNTLRNLDDRLKGVLETLIEERITVGSEFAVYPPKINSRLAALASRIGASQTLPSKQHYDVLEDLSTRADKAIREFAKLEGDDLPEVSDQLRMTEILLLAAQADASRNRS